MKYTQSSLGVTVAEAQSIASVLAGQLKVSIKEGKSWLYDYSARQVNYRREDLSILSQEDVVANLLHETGHAKYSIDPRLWNYGYIPTQHKEGAKATINLLEDFRMENQIREEYPYAKDYLPEYGFKTKWYFQRITKLYEERAKEAGYKEEVPKIIQYLNLVYGYISGEAMLMLGETKPQVQECFDKTKDKMLDIKDTSKNTEDIVRSIVNDIYPIIKILFDDSPPPPKPQPKPSASMASKAEKKEPTKEKGEDKPKDGKDPSKPEDGDKSDGKKPEPKDPSDPKDGDEPGKSGEEPKEGEPEEKEEDTRPTLADGFDKDWQQDVVRGFKHSFSDKERKHEPYEDMYPKVKPHINKTVDKLRKILTDKAFDKFEGKYNSGKINQRRMYKPRTGDFRVFQRRVEAGSKDYEFALVIDMSGSMTGSKIEAAIQSSMLFAHVLNKLEIPYLIFGFNRYMFEHKLTEQKYDINLGKKIAQSQYEETYDMAGSKRGAGDNNDAEAIYQVKQLLKKSKSKKKVMLVFSDGYPANTPGKYKHTNLELEVKKTIKEGVDVIAFGLHYGGISNFYPNSVIVNDVSELADETVKVLKRVLKK